MVCNDGKISEKELLVGENENLKKLAKRHGLGIC
jgi:hypothetical protein